MSEEKVQTGDIVIVIGRVRDEISSIKQGEELMVKNVNSAQDWCTVEKLDGTGSTGTTFIVPLYRLRPIIFCRALHQRIAELEAKVARQTQELNERDK